MTTTNYFERLSHANNVLDGYTQDRFHKTHRGFAEEGVISLLEGGAIRRPDISVINALVSCLYQPDLFPIESYTNYDVLPGLWEAVQQRFLSWGVLPSLAAKIVFTNSSTQALNAFLNSTCRAGDTVLTVQGFYHPFAAIPHKNQIHMECVPTSKASDYKLTAENLEAFMQNYEGNKPKAILFTNPTSFGVCYKKEELKQLADIIQKYKLLVYEDAVFKGTEHKTPTSLLSSISGMESHVVVATSLSKSLNSANVRMGWACGPEFLVSRMITYMRDESITISQFSQIAALAALQMPQNFIRANIDEVRSRIVMVKNLVDEINTSLCQIYTSPHGQDFVKIEVVPQSGHSVLLNFEGLAGLKSPVGSIIHSDLDITRYLLDYGVGVSPTYSCGFIDRFCVRVALAEIDNAPTRHAVQRYELHQGIQQLLGLAAPGQSQNLWQQIAPQLGGGFTQEMMETNIENAFAEVRQILAAAFRERILPALEDLLKYNHLNKGDVRETAA